MGTCMLDEGSPLFACTINVSNINAKWKLIHEEYICDSCVDIERTMTFTVCRRFTDERSRTVDASIAASVSSSVSAEISHEVALEFSTQRTEEKRFSVPAGAHVSFWQLVISW